MTLKIGLLNDSFPPIIDGVASCVYNYAQVLSDHGAKVTVVTPSVPHVKDENSFPVFRYLSFNFGKRIGYRVGWPHPWKTIRKMKREDFDILHVHSPFVSSLIASSVTGKRHTKPVVLTYHTKFEFDIERRAPTKLLQKITSRFVLHNLNQADEIWAVSNGAAESLRYLGYTGPYRVMENGTDFQRGQASPEQQKELRRQWNLSPDRMTFLFVGRMMWYKNVRLILDSLARLNDAGVPFQMIFVGDGIDRPAIMEYTEKLELTDSVVFAGAVHDREMVRAYFSVADLFLFPSTYDTSGLVVKEAAACSCPAVLVEGSCAAEGITHNRNGFLCRENPEDCARAIAEAIRNPTALRAVGEAACREVYISWDDAAQKAYARYEEIIAAHKAKQKG